jgi:hypothetical protein
MDASPKEAKSKRLGSVQPVGVACRTHACDAAAPTLPHPEKVSSQDVA